MAVVDAQGCQVVRSVSDSVSGLSPFTCSGSRDLCVARVNYKRQPAVFGAATERPNDGALVERR